ncbi:histidine kinase [Streptosporangium soli]|nr:histidine kinase [Streptosporangium sp. KLBMP 9127]
MTLLRRSATAVVRGVVLAAIGVVQVVVAVVVLGALLCTVGLGMVFLFFPAVWLTRAWTGLARRLAGRWCGVAIASPYRPKPPPPVRQPDGWYRSGRSLYKSPSLPKLSLRIDWTFKDPATWRDFAWLFSYCFGGPLLPLLPAALPVYGAALALTGEPLMVATGAALAVLGFLAAPLILRVHGLWLRGLLGPTEKSRLAGQVRHLAETRTETVGSQAAQLRRIERDLHDGAQARLVAVGMTLSAAEELVDTDPAAAEALIAKSREASALALAELRRLVRGIQPPVLADRGLAEALRALALDSPLKVTVRADLPDRCDAPVEAAVYFAVSELLTNATRHGDAHQVTVEAALSGRALVVTVTDDGCGGADPERGSGLRGIERRMASFDGTLLLHSPPGGPTAVTLEVPEAISAPAPVATGLPRWKKVLMCFCYGSFALPLFPLGIVAAIFKLTAAPYDRWAGWLGPAGPLGWVTITAMIVLGLALLATATVLSVQNTRLRKLEPAE